jgi:hypothetical protein
MCQSSNRDSKLSQSGTARDHIKNKTAENRDLKSWHGLCNDFHESRMVSLPGGFHCCNIVALLLHCFSLWLAARALRQSTNFGADRICDQRRFFI